MSRRLVRVAMSGQLILNVLAKGWRADPARVMTNIEGLPEDAVLVGAEYDFAWQSAVLYFESPAFEPVEPGTQPPFLTPVLGSEEHPSLAVIAKLQEHIQFLEVLNSELRTALEALSPQPTFPLEPLHPGYSLESRGRPLDIRFDPPEEAWVSVTLPAGTRPEDVGRRGDDTP